MSKVLGQDSWWVRSLGKKWERFINRKISVIWSINLEEMQAI